MATYLSPEEKSPSSEWTTVVNTKKIRRTARIKARREEKEKWDAILKVCPHAITPDRAKRLEKRLNITGLATKLTSDEWIEYQKEGWEYHKTYKPKDFLLEFGEDGKVSERTVFKRSRLPPENGNYSFLGVQNGWGDKAVFWRF